MNVRVTIALVAASLLGGCHLIFQYEDTPPDGAPAGDMPSDGLADGKQAGDRQAPPDTEHLPDLKPAPDGGCPKGQTRCGNMCVNLQTDKGNCGKCGGKCDASTTDSCVNGKCVCGAAATACKNSLNCDKGKCRCLAGGLCKQGCCSNDICHGYAKQSKDACGQAGVKCQPCNDNQECTNDSCVLGQCKVQPLSTGQCLNKTGDCHNGKCCTTCVQNGGCIKTVSAIACGKGGGACTVCGDGNTCTKDECDTNGQCVYAAISGVVTCSKGGISGVCMGGLCCTGCLNKQGTTACVPFASQTISQCGAQAAECKACPQPAPNEVCKVADCTVAGCGFKDRPGGYACTDPTNYKPGKCQNGVCCSGCWTLSPPRMCKPGNGLSATYCGKGGNWCQICTSSQQCCDDACLPTCI